MLCHLFKITQLVGNGAGIQIYVYLLILKPHLNFLFYVGVVVLLLSHVRLFVTPWTAARQVSLSFTIFRSLLKLMYITSVMPSKHLIFYRPFSSCPQSFPAAGSFPMSQPFPSHRQNIGASASASVLPMNIQG